MATGDRTTIRLGHTMIDVVEMERPVSGRLDFVALASETERELNQPRPAPPAAATQRVTPWMDQQVAAAEALVGRTTASWLGVEMAVRSNDDESAFAFTDPHVPCLQLWGLTAELDDGSIVRIGTYQNDEDCGLETATERIEFHRFDESVLVFQSQAAYDSVEWIPHD